MTGTDIFVTLGVTASVVMTIINFADYRMRKARLTFIIDETRKNEIKHLIRDETPNVVEPIITQRLKEFTLSDEMTRAVLKAINDSEVNRKVDSLIKILCTRINELKDSKVCD